MAIKRRSNIPNTNDVKPKAKLEIVAKPKDPIPEGGVISRMFGPEPNASGLRSLGLLAIDCRAPTADHDLTVEDSVTLMRTSLDADNPQEQRYRDRTRNRATAITAMCITCVGGRKAVTECIDTKCPLWSFRLGSDPFYKRSKS